MWSGLVNAPRLMLESFFTWAVWWCTLPMDCLLCWNYKFLCAFYRLGFHRNNFSLVFLVILIQISWTIAMWWSWNMGSLWFSVSLLIVTCLSVWTKLFSKVKKLVIGDHFSTHGRLAEEKMTRFGPRHGLCGQRALWWRWRHRENLLCITLYYFRFMGLKYYHDFMTMLSRLLDIWLQYFWYTVFFSSTWY
jgi:hypothetical protein